jgi:hypothetical protein
MTLLAFSSNCCTKSIRQSHKTKGYSVNPSYTATHRSAFSFTFELFPRCGTERDRTGILLATICYSVV